MNDGKKALLAFLCLSLPFIAIAQQITSAFRIIPLGVKGGSDESNLSSYLLSSAGSNDFICLDAGTLHYGIQKAIDAGTLKGNASDVLKKSIKAYCISHPHLDHVAGMIINSPDDSAKNIYALPFCADVLKEKYFSWKSWANFADEGEKPQLNKYHYQNLTAGVETAIENTPFFITAFELSHSNPYKSTAFLVRNQDQFILYLGDTGADSIEHANNLLLLWQHITPLIKQKKLKAIFIEVSFDDAQPLTSLFGHLTPALLMHEMNVLNNLAGKQAMQNFPIVITHEKPGGNRENFIKKQLLQHNKLNLRLIFPTQGKRLLF